MSSEAPVDRRRLRHQQTADEVVTVALEVMTESGAGGMSLGEVARRMGIRTPSLYVYFPSKDALYDEIFSRGWVEASEAMQVYEPELGSTTDAGAYLLAVATGFVRWALEHPAYAQLMFWRPVPGWEPTAAAYAPAVALLDRADAAFAELQRRGLLSAHVDIDEAARVWNVLVSGVISQQLANEPRADVESGRYARLIGPITQIFLARYASTTTSTVKGKKR